MWTEENIEGFWQHHYASFAGDANAKEIYRLSKKYVSGKVLDVGAGSGALLNLIPNAVGIDLVPKHPRIVKATIAKLPMADGIYDTVFACDILEHLTTKTLEAGLAEIYRVMVNSGFFIMVVPYKEDLKESTVWCPNCHAQFHRWGHIQVFNKRIMYELLRKHGFSIELMKTVSLSLMAQYELVHYTYPALVLFGLIRPNDLLVVARKNAETQAS